MQHHDACLDLALYSITQETATVNFDRCSISICGLKLCALLAENYSGQIAECGLGPLL
jgi:hypothetical protein